jgi:glucose/arabinose dehydrogenase
MQSQVSWSRSVSAFALAAALVGGASVASAASLPTGFTETTFSGITNPTALAIAPDGRVFVSQQCGAIRIIKNGAVLSTPFASISVSCSDERGLHSIAFDPNFSSNGYVYVRYTRASPLNNVIGRLQASPPSSDTGSGLTVLFTVPFNGTTQRYHHGGGLVVGNDGKLYSSFGDHLSGSGQNLNNLWGKVVRINIPNGGIPTDNPFYNTTTGDNRAIWAYGFRNPFTMAIQPGTGRIHVNDVGNSASACCEEVNNLTRGTNYDWPNSMGSNDYFGYTASSQGGNAIVGGGFYNPTNVNFPSSYVGRYFFGDYGGGWIRSIVGSGSPGSITGFATGISGPTDVEAHHDGTLWYTARNSSNVRRICYQGCPGGLPTPTPSPSPTPTPIGPTPTPTATSAPNALPNPVINTPPTGTLYRGGDSVSFSGSCTDPEDGTVPASGFAWDIVFHHNTHTHPGVQFNDVASGSFDLPVDGEWDPDQWWRVNFTCMDSDGGSRTVTRDVLPRTHTLTVNSSPSGLQVAADGVTGAAPITPQAVAGMVRILDTTAPQTMGGTQYFFQSWSDGGEKRHNITMPDAAASRTANFLAASAYSEVTPGAAGVTTSTSDTNVGANTVDNNLATRWSGNGDGAWVRFDLGTTMTIGHIRTAAYQGNMRRNRFDIQVSNDGSSWSTVFSGETSGTTTNEETFDFRDASGRYVRYLGHGNIGSTNPTMNSVTEVSIFGITAITPTPTPTPIVPTPTPTNTPVTPVPPTPTPTPTTPAGGDVEITPGGGAVTASTNDGNLPANAVDGSLATRWSANGDGQWLRFDLGTAQTVSYVKIASYTGNVRAIRFDIQCSNDGTNWTNLLTGGQSSGTTLALETFDVTDGSCRYVRYLGHGNTVNMWNSLTEVEIWQSGGGPPPPTPTPTNTPVVPVPTATPTPTPSGTSSNLALGRPATASSVEGAGFEAGMAVDGNATSRWASAEGVDPQWIYVDLGSSRSINRVVLRWEAAFGSAYTIATSNDASNWTTIHTTTAGDGGVDDLTVSGTGRYVRMHGTARGTAWGYSLFEYEVWGQ